MHGPLRHFPGHASNFFCQSDFLFFFANRSPDVTHVSLCVSMNCLILHRSYPHISQSFKYCRKKNKTKLTQCCNDVRSLTHKTLQQVKSRMSMFGDLRECHHLTCATGIMVDWFLDGWHHVAVFISLNAVAVCSGCLITCACTFYSSWKPSFYEWHFQENLSFLDLNPTRQTCMAKQYYCWSRYLNWTHCG